MILIKFKNLCFITILISLSLNCYGNNSIPTFELFKKGSNEFKPNYYKILGKIRDEEPLYLKMGDGTTFLCEKFLGEGGTTFIAQVKIVKKGTLSKESYALRLPQEGYFQRFLEYTLETYDYLTYFDIPVTKLIKSSPKQYILMELMPEFIRGDQLFKQPLLFKDEVVYKASLSFIELTKKLAPFSEFIDFYAHQLAYLPNEDRWILFDWSAKPTLVTDLTVQKNEHIFNPEGRFAKQIKVIRPKQPEYEAVVRRFQEKLLTRIDEAIKEERARTFNSSTRCNQLLFYLLKNLAH